MLGDLHRNDGLASLKVPGSCFFTACVLCSAACRGVSPWIAWVEYEHKLLTGWVHRAQTAVRSVYIRE